MWNRATSASAAVQHTAALSRLSRTSTGSNSGRLTGSGPLTGTAFSETRSLTGTNPRRPGLRVRGGDGQPQLVRSFSLPAPRLQASLYPGEASPLRTLSDPCRVSSALLEAADRRTKSRARIPRSRSAHVLGSPGVEELWRQAMCRVIYVRPGTCTGWRFEAPGHRLAAESPRGVDSQDSQQPSADVARRQADGAAAQEDAGNAGRVAGLRGGARLTAQGDAEAGIGLGQQRGRWRGCRGVSGSGWAAVGESRQILAHLYLPVGRWEFSG
ncbi:hypothetical protein CLOM_g5912 [Closterium sp. NIES-68]|nr:hypothetical protein CLOM_g5912 [Closterium sp. NIES-68]